MKTKKALSKLNQLLKGSGVEINGPNVYDPQIKDKFIVPFYNRIIEYWSLGLGETYMDRWWECEKLDEFFTRILSSGLEERFKPWRMILPYIKATLFNLQTRTRSKKVARNHYDLSVRLYESFLDPYNQYTCGYFNNTQDLNQAQKNKLELICRKLHISSEDHILDIGCGWGGFAKFASKNYRCRVTGITISKEQAKYAHEFTRGLPVQILFKDYRDLGKEKYSKILCCGMIEHVGYRNYRTFMEAVHRSLLKGGLFLLHTIGGLKPVKHADPWISKYIFPNSMVPSANQILNASSGLFAIQDFHNFGHYYYQTLMAWYDNFKMNWISTKGENFDDRFFRMWEYYLMCSAGTFQARISQLHQFVFSKNLTEPYISVR